MTQKNCGMDNNTVYAMKIIDVPVEGDRDKYQTECYVHQLCCQFPFLVALCYTFQTKSKICLALGPRHVGNDDFKIIKLLGKGGFGEVYLARKKDGSDAGKLYAMKNMKRRRLTKRTDIDHAWTERRVFEKTRDCPFLVQLHYAFLSNERLHLVTDYVAGKDFVELLEQRGRLTENETRFFSAEVILALQHLHELGIVHRDVKPENILLDAEGHVLLTDFGLSKEFPSDQEDKRTYSCSGTPEYMAPEVILRIGHDMAADWWSMGIVVYEMLSYTRPFEERSNIQTLFTKILTQEPVFPLFFPPCASHLIARLLAKDPRMRLGGGPRGAEGIKSHPFYATIDWVQLRGKKVSPPFLPHLDIISADDVDENQFGVASDPRSAGTWRPRSNDPFKNFSFVSPSLDETSLERATTIEYPTAPVSSAPLASSHDCIPESTNQGPDPTCDTDHPSRIPETILRIPIPARGVVTEDRVLQIATHQQNPRKPQKRRHVLSAEDGGGQRKRRIV